MFSMVSSQSPISERLTALRDAMKAQGVDGFIVPRTDRFQNEYVTAYAERLHFISGFSGSAGVAVIFQDSAFLFTDGRYTAQAAYECDTGLFEIIDCVKTKTEDFLAEREGVMGYDPWLLSCHQLRVLSDKGVNLKALDKNLIDQIWDDQPDEPDEVRETFPDGIAGRTSDDKIKSLAFDGDALLVTHPENIAWLLNQRGNSIPHTPVVCAYGLVKGGVFHELTPPYDLAFLEGKTVALDFKTAPAWFKLQLDTVIDCPGVFAGQAIKTSSEYESIKQAHIKDGVAMVKFLKWVDEQAIGKTELEIMAQLEKFRAEEDAYRGPSFSTIAGFATNGAIIHYHASEATNKVIAEGSFLLVDSGGQYGGGDVWGTTDITRTIAIGEVSTAMQEHYTRVLMGHIDLAMAQFDAQTSGKALDAIARTPLKDVGLDYAHGTGHGVGCYLSVHETAAQGISPRSEEPLAAGMVLSNEPGYYEEGSHGIRIENLVYIAGEGEGLCFETITLAPIDTSCVVWDIMSPTQRQWLEDYHKRVFEVLCPFLDADEQKWLKKKVL